MPPRHGKSELCSKYFPVWYMGTFPKNNVILTSATDDLALDFSEAARDLMHEFGPELFGVEVRSDAKSKQLWKLKQGGSLRAAGVGGSIMGRGANLFIIDDYFKNVEEALSETNRKKLHQWYLSTASTRLTPTGGVVLICTRWHRLDLTGQLLDDATRGGDQWEIIRLPAICDDPETDVLEREEGEALWPESEFNKQWLEARRNVYISGGQEWMWSALYQQVPPSVLDAEFSPEYFTDKDNFKDDEYPVKDKHRWRLMALDPSLGKNNRSDFSAWIAATLDFDGMIWVDADIQRRDSVRICEDGIEMMRSFRPHAIFAESVGFQEVLQTQFQKSLVQAGFATPVYGMNNRENKRVRIRSTLTPYLAQHKFRWRFGSPGVAVLLEQLRGFPTVKNDDGPDALEMAIRGFQYLIEHGAIPVVSDGFTYDDGYNR